MTRNLEEDQPERERLHRRLANEQFQHRNDFVNEMDDLTYRAKPVCLQHTDRRGKVKDVLALVNP